MKRSTIEVLLEDIKNYKPLSESQLEKIESLTNEEKITIIHLFASSMRKVTVPFHSIMPEKRAQ
jgi:hypothetical protein